MGGEDDGTVRLSLLCLGVATAALAAPATAAAADFTITPSTVVSGVLTVKTGTLLTYDATPADPADSWDLDGNGVAGDQIGSPVQWAYATPGPVAVTLNAPEGPVTRVIQVVGPAADFHTSPAAPVAGQIVNFAYSQRQDVAAIDWDLNGDRDFNDAHGPIASTVFPAPGTYAVSLRVSNLDDPPARSTSTQLINVVPASVTRSLNPVLRLMSPFPVVRITGKVGKAGARIKRLTVRAPAGATVAVRCRGRSCPFRRLNRTVTSAGIGKSASKTVRVKRLERKLLRTGSLIKVLVSRPGEIGKYTRFKIRRGNPPLRTDLCLLPGSTVPKECPTS